MLLQFLTNFEISKYYQNEPKFSGVYPRNNLTKIKDGAFVINFDEFKSIGNHGIDFYVNGNNIIYFDRFEVGHISKEIKKIYKKQKYHNKYLDVTSLRFDNVWILLYWIY